MALVSGRSSALNPNAPLFIPAAFRQVEDFSPQWWELVKSSTWFRDYWMSQHEEEDFGESGDNDMENMFSETFDLGVEQDIDFLENEFEKFVMFDEAQECLDINDPVDERMTLHVNKDASALVKILSPKERGPKSPISSAKHFAKPAQYVNIKCAPQRIHQPRRD